MSIRHTLAAALAVSAIAAPAASAMPSPPDMHASTAQAAAQERQDLRGEAARDAALHPRKAQAIDARGATAVDSQTRVTPVAPGQPTWAVNPKPLPPPTSTQVAVTSSDDGIDWMSIGIGVAGSLLVLGGVAVLMSRTGRLPRAGVSA